MNNGNSGEGSPSPGKLRMMKALAYGVTGAALAGMLWAGSRGSRQDTSYSPPRSGQAEFSYQPVAPPRTELDINIAAFSEYQSRREEKYNEFARSHQVNMRQITVPEGMSVPADGLGSGAFALDINGDGIEEIYLQSGCGSGGCFGSIYHDSGSGYVEILGTPIDRISSRVVNGWPVVSDARKHYLPGGGFTDMVVEYSWDGQRFIEGDKFIIPEFMPSIVYNINTYFDGRNPEKTSEFLRVLEKSIGTDYALRAWLQFQSPPGFTMPTGSEYVEYVRQYAMEVERTNPGVGERALTRYANDPAGFFAALYGRSSERSFLDISNPRSIVGVSLAMTLKRLGRSDWERHMDLWNRAQNNSGFIAAYRNATGHYPQTEEDLWSARNNVVREDKLPAIPIQDTSRFERSESPSGTIESRTFTPGQVTGDPNYRNYQPQQQPQPADHDLSRQMDRTSREGAERARQMGNQIGKQLENIFRPQDPDKDK